MFQPTPDNQAQGQQMRRQQIQEQRKSPENQGQEQGEDPSTREMQRGVGDRVSATGQSMAKPRLAGSRRQSSGVGGMVKKAVKKKAKKWLIGAAFGGTIGGSGLGFWSFF